MTSPHEATLEDVSSELESDEPSAAPEKETAADESVAEEEAAPATAPEPAAGQETAAPTSEKPKKPSKKQVKIEALEAKIRQLEDSPTPTAAGRRRLLIPVVAGLVIIVLAAALVVTGLKVRHADQTSSARTSALSAARTYGVDLSTYDYQKLTADFAAVTDHSTSSFAKTFDKQSALLEPVLTKYKATAKASVLAAGVTSASVSRAVVLVLVSQKVTNTVQKHGSTTDRSQVVLTLVKQGGHWLINNAELL
jgi:Mce-associated membrane protein